MSPHLSERTLILAPRGRDGEVALRLLVEASLPCQDLPSPVAGLEEGGGVAILTDDALRTADLAPVAAWIEAQPDWSDFPFILLTERGGPQRTPSASRHLGVLGQRLLP